MRSFICSSMLLFRKIFGWLWWKHFALTGYRKWLNRSRRHLWATALSQDATKFKWLRTSTIHLLMDGKPGLGSTVSSERNYAYIVISLKKVKFDMPLYPPLKMNIFGQVNIFLGMFQKIRHIYCKNVLEGESLSQFSNFGTNSLSHSFSNTVPNL